MTDPALMRGDGWVRCCMCGELHEHPYPGLYVDAEGGVWDLCDGICAAMAGMTSAVDDRTDHVHDARHDADDECNVGEGFVHDTEANLPGSDAK